MGNFNVFSEGNTNDIFEKGADNKFKMAGTGVLITSIKWLLANFMAFINFIWGKKRVHKDKDT